MTSTITTITREEVKIMKYFIFLLALGMPSLGCAATLHTPYVVYDDCEYEYEWVYVPRKKVKVVTVYPGSHHHPRYIRHRVVKGHPHHVRYKKRYKKKHKKHKKVVHTHKYH